MKCNENKNQTLISISLRISALSCTIYCWPMQQNSYDSTALDTVQNVIKVDEYSVISRETLECKFLFTRANLRICPVPLWWTMEINFPLKQTAEVIYQINMMNKLYYMARCECARENLPCRHRSKRLNVYLNVIDMKTNGKWNVWKRVQ